jgi:hypothetical protein
MFAWKDILGGMEDGSKKINTIKFKNNIVTCIRTLCVMVSQDAIDISNEFHKKNILTDEIAQVFIHEISPFIERKDSCFEIVDNDVIIEAQGRNFKSRVKFGYMWSNHLLKKIKSLMYTNYKFIGVIEAPKRNTPNKIVKKYPNIDINIPGGKVSLSSISDIDEEILCIKEGLRELEEETGFSFTGPIEYLCSTNQIDIRKKYHLENLPLHVYRKNTDVKGDLILIWLI